MEKDLKKSQEKKLLVPEEEQDKLIEEYFSKEEAESLIKAGYSKDKIAWVAKENKRQDFEAGILGKILRVLIAMLLFTV